MRAPPVEVALLRYDLLYPTSQFVRTPADTWITPATVVVARTEKLSLNVRRLMSLADSTKLPTDVVPRPRHLLPIIVRPSAVFAAPVADTMFRKFRTPDVSRNSLPMSVKFAPVRVKQRAIDRKFATNKQFS